MSRLVMAKAPAPRIAQFAKGQRSQTTKEYLERVGKYVPGEIVAAYTPLITLALDMHDPVKKIWLAGSFLLCLGLTPLYFAKMAKPGEPKRKQQWVSTVAFALWSYTVGAENGIFGSASLNLYEPHVATGLLIVFTLFSGLVVPKIGEP